nr:uncharacterized protein LOC109157470 [Ipomoea trifida]
MAERTSPVILTASFVTMAVRPVYFPSSAPFLLQMSMPPMVFPPCHEKVAAKLPQYDYHHGPGNTGHIYLIQHGN